MRLVRRKPRAPLDDDERVLPLINVVFLLLIFFMVAGRLSSSDPFEITPMEAQTGEAVDPDGALLLIGPSGALALDGEEMDEDAVFARLSNARAADDAFRVRIKSDGGAEAIAVVRILERLRAIGVAEVKLMTVPDRSR